MKRLYLLLVLALGALCVKAQTIDPLLQEEMDKRSSEEQIEVFVLMKAQCDRTMLHNRTNQLATRAERRSFVVDELKSFAETSQRDLKKALFEMETKGTVTAPRTLWLANALCFSATPSAIRELAQRDDIAKIGYDIKRIYIAENERPMPASESREITPNLLQINADKVWELGYTGQGVVVSVIDGGVNYNHLDLADHLWDGGEAFPNHGYDIVNEDNDPMDDVIGHGTHCAGTVCGDGTAGSQTGVAPDATLMCVKCVSASFEGGATTMSDGMAWSLEQGCDLMSISLGSIGSSVAERELLRRTSVSTLDAGVASFVCAGNEGFDLNQYPIPYNVRDLGSCPPPYLTPDQQANPGGLSSVICVGAVDENEEPAYFTAHGPCTWQDTEFGDYPYEPGIGLIRPDICAPGEHIKSPDYANINGYKEFSGTSQATPAAAGIAALMLQKNPELTPAEICRILQESSVKLTPNQSNLTGIGRVDALAAIEMVPTWDAVSETTERQAHIYPNPTQGTFTVTCEDMNLIEVFSIDGTCIQTVNPQSSQCRIELLGSGLYILKISTKTGILTKKVVKY